MNGSIKLGKLFGIPFQVSYTWFLIFGIVTFSLAYGQFPRQHPFWPQSTHIILGVITSLLFFASVIVHELAHGAVAKALGIPVKSITLFIFGGVAQIGSEAGRPVSELVMAGIGPFSSLVLAALFALVWMISEPIHAPTAALSGWLASINLSLAVFNMVPGFPLDGGRVFRSILWWITGNYQRSTLIAIFVGQAIAYLMIIGGIALVVANPRILMSGIWIVLIGWFLERAAVSSRRQLRIRDYLQGYKARDLMAREFSPVQQGTTLEEIVERYVMPTRWRWPLVLDGNRLMGVLTLKGIRRFARSQWPSVNVEQAMTPVETLQKISPEDSALQVLERLDEDGVGHVLVVEDGRFLGIVAAEDIMELVGARGRLRA